MPQTSLVVDAYGRRFDYEAMPQATVSPIGRDYDQFSNRRIQDEIKPEFIAMAIAGRLSVSQTQLLCQRVLDNDSHFAGAWRDYSDSISGNDWEVVPRDKQSRADKRMAAKVAADLQEQLTDLPVGEMISALLWGDYGPFGWAENVWDLATKDLKGWELPDVVRQYWDPMNSTLRVLTKAQPSFGEELAANMWVIHSAKIRPGSPRQGGTWKSILWDYAWKHYSMANWLELSDVWGLPQILAFIEDPKDRDAVLIALRKLGRSAKGAFPKGTEVRIEDASSSGTVDIFEKMVSRCDDNASIIFTGHDLITRAKAGTGTLAGKGAQRVAEKLIKRGSRGVMETFRRDVVKVRATLKFGYDVAMEFCPTWKLKFEPPIDVIARGRSMVMVNSLLAATGDAIDPQQIQEEFGIAKIVKRVAAPGADTVPADNASDTDAQDAEALDASRRPRRRVAAAVPVPAAHPLKTHEDVERVGAALAQRQFAAAGADIHDIINSDIPLEEMAAALWESYPDIGKPRKFASLARDVMVTNAVIGVADVHQEVASADS
jgi:phage gp29-like protein